MRRKRTLAKTVGAAALVVGAINMQAPTVDAADHTDSPAVQPTEAAAADIADLYAWHDSGTITVVMTFAGVLPLEDYPVYDSDILYTIHIDNTAAEADLLDWANGTNDNESDIDIHVRFGQNMLGEWFAQVTDLPGADAELVGAVEGDIGDEGARVFVGPFEDPFFFDLDGLNDTIANIGTDDTMGNIADVAFGGAAGAPVDAFAGLNVMAIVMEFPAADALNGNADNVLQIWGTTGRVPR